MRLTTYTDYTLRVLMYLGLHQERSATIREIADAYGISKNHLMKVVHHLGMAGLVETVRGRNGGLKLKMPPEEINLGRVIRSSEPDFFIAECFDPERNRCVLSPACALQGVLHDATRAFLEVLDQNTLAGLLHRTGPTRLQAGTATPIRLRRLRKQGGEHRPESEAG